MTQRIGQQARQVWQVLSAPQTGRAYQTVAVTTWTILKETGMLLWLLVCLVLVTLDWSINGAIAAGRVSRYAVAQASQIRTDTLATDTKQALLMAGKTGLANTLSQARSQLGMEPGAAQGKPTNAPTAPEAPAATAAVSTVSTPPAALKAAPQATPEHSEPPAVTVTATTEEDPEEA